MARLHGGGVSVESAPDQGSRFTITLPSAGADLSEWVEALEAGQPLTPPEEPQPVEGARPQPVVLLVDDTDSVILSVSGYLPAQGYRVVVARSGREGIERARELNPDAILMDVHLPDLDGLEVTRRMRADPALRRTPILAIAALALPGDRERYLAAGMTAYLSKPVSVHQLLSSLQLHTRPA
jgi:CheY-like chemotaxis protein